MMPNPRIEVSTATLDPGAPPDHGAEVFTPLEMIEDVNRYWGIGQTEKIFVLPAWKAERLLAESNLNQFALKVSNIEDPANVDAEWISFNADVNPVFTTSDADEKLKQVIIKVLHQVPQYLNAEDDAYFVLDQSVFDQFRPLFVGPLFSIVAKIGKTPQGNEVIYFILGQINLILDNGGGGPGATSGAKIPRPE